MFYMIEQIVETFIFPYPEFKFEKTICVEPYVVIGVINEYDNEINFKNQGIRIGKNGKIKKMTYYKYVENEFLLYMFENDVRLKFYIEMDKDTEKNQPKIMIHIFSIIDNIDIIFEMGEKSKEYYTKINYDSIELDKIYEFIKNK